MKTLTTQITKLNQNIEKQNQLMEKLLNLMENGQSSSVLVGVIANATEMSNNSEVMNAIFSDSKDFPVMGLVSNGLRHSRSGNKKVVEVLDEEIHSSCISKVEYVPSSKTLHVTFKTSKKTYAYSNVSKDLYQDFVTAPSLGRFHHRHIRSIPAKALSIVR